MQCWVSSARSHRLAPRTGGAGRPSTEHLYGRVGGGAVPSMESAETLRIRARFARAVSSRHAKITRAPRSVCLKPGCTARVPWPPQVRVGCHTVVRGDVSGDTVCFYVTVVWF